MHILPWNLEESGRKAFHFGMGQKGNSEKHHKWLEHDEGVRSTVPVRKGYRKGFFRKKLLEKFPQKTYNKRNHSGITVRLYKHSFGESLKARSLKGRRAELAACTLTHNLNQRLKIIMVWTFQCDHFMKRFIN